MPSVDDMMGGLSNAADRSMAKPARRILDYLMVPGYMQGEDSLAALLAKRAKEIEQGIKPSESDKALKDALQKRAMDISVLMGGAK